MPSTDLRKDTADARAVAKAHDRPRRWARLAWSRSGCATRPWRAGQERSARPRAGSPTYGRTPTRSTRAPLRRFGSLSLMPLMATSAEIGAAASDEVADRLDGLVKPRHLYAEIGATVGNSRGAHRADGADRPIPDPGVKDLPFLTLACRRGVLRHARVGISTFGPGAGVNCSTVMPGATRQHVAGIAAGRAIPDPVAIDEALDAGHVRERVPPRRQFRPNFLHRPEPVAPAYWSDAAAKSSTCSTAAAAPTSRAQPGPRRRRRLVTRQRLRHAAALDNLGGQIATVVAAGNDSYPHGLSEPPRARLRPAAPATRPTSFRRGHSSNYLSLLAPGVGIRSSVPGGGFAFMSGTSMAAPHVTGAFALMKQAHPNAGVSEIVARMRQTGRPVFDPKGGRTTPRLNIDRAIRTARSTPTSPETCTLTSRFGARLRTNGGSPARALHSGATRATSRCRATTTATATVEKAMFRPSTGTW